MSNTQQTVLIVYPTFNPPANSPWLQPFDAQIARRTDQLTRLGYPVVTAEIEKGGTLEGQKALKELIKKHAKALVMPIGGPLAAQAALLGCTIAFGVGEDSIYILNQETA